MEMLHPENCEYVSHISNENATIKKQIAMCQSYTNKISVELIKATGIDTLQSM